MRPIDADKLKSELFDADWMMDNDEHMVEKIVERQPTVDAEPIRHGHWIWCETYLDGEPEYPCELLKEGWACSACGAYLMEYLQSHFHDIPSYAECISDEMPTVERCPHCGAKMDEYDDATH